MMSVPDITLVSDGKGDDENIIDLEAVARAATAKLEKDLVDAKEWNDRIAWKKKERADRLRKKKEDEDAAEAKKKADMDAVEAKRKADEEAREKVPVQPLVSCVLSVFLGWKLIWFPDWAGCPAQERDGGAVQV